MGRVAPKQWAPPSTEGGKERRSAHHLLRGELRHETAIFWSGLRESRLVTPAELNHGLRDRRREDRHEHEAGESDGRDDVGLQHHREHDDLHQPFALHETSELEASEPGQFGHKPGRDDGTQELADAREYRDDREDRPNIVTPPVEGGRKAGLREEERQEDHAHDRVELLLETMSHFLGHCHTGTERAKQEMHPDELGRDRRCEDEAADTHELSVVGIGAQHLVRDQLREKRPDEAEHHGQEQHREEDDSTDAVMSAPPAGKSEECGHENPEQCVVDGGEPKSPASRLLVDHVEIDERSRENGQRRHTASDPNRESERLRGRACAHELWIVAHEPPATDEAERERYEQARRRRQPEGPALPLDTIHVQVGTRHEPKEDESRPRQPVEGAERRTRKQSFVRAV